MSKSAKLTCRIAMLCGIAVSATAQTRVAPPAGGSLAERYQQAQTGLSEARDKAARTLAEKDRLAAEELPIRERLVNNAAKLQELEEMAAETTAERDRLNTEISTLKNDLSHEQSGLVQVLAMLQRISSDQRAGALTQPDDALRAMRAALQAGGALKPLYLNETQLLAQLKSLANLQAQAAARQTEAEREQQALNDTSAELDRLMAEKRSQEAGLAGTADDLQKVVDEIGHEAAGLKALMDRIASLRVAGNNNLPRIKGAGPGSSSAATLIRGSLRLPVPGKYTPGDPAGPGVTPGASGPTGLWFQSSGKTEAVAPGDSEVVFAGTYLKLGQVLILEMAGGYHLALAGLGRIDVHVGDLVLAGEPVGILPEGKAAPLYMELRRNGKVVDLAPWVSADIGKAKGT
jgi:murein hydrolase activator